MWARAGTALPSVLEEANSNCVRRVPWRRSRSRTSSSCGETTSAGGTSASTTAARWATGPPTSTGWPRKVWPSATTTVSRAAPPAGRPSSPDRIPSAPASPRWGCRERTWACAPRILPSPNSSNRWDMSPASSARTTWETRTSSYPAFTGSTSSSGTCTTSMPRRSRSNWTIPKIRDSASASVHGASSTATPTGGSRTPGPSPRSAWRP